METALLYTLAAKQGAKALSVCTVSDEIFGSGMTTSQEREQSFEVAVHIALDAITVVDG
jgi:purine-nucleoside phosphorylase